MTWLDKYLQNRRIHKALDNVPNGASLLDIGCHKGELLMMAKDKIINGIGIDPLCTPSFPANNIQLLKGLFPGVLQNEKRFDCITALAVLEHIPLTEQASFMNACFLNLNEKGKLILTVPDAKVDNILAVLTRVGLIKGMSFEEHFGFDARSTVPVAEKEGFHLLIHKRFQMGLNNLFVFIKPAAT